MDLVSRVKGLLLDPQTEWRRIAAEPATPIDLIRNYVAILAAIPAICGFVGSSIIGVAGYRTGFFAGLFGAVAGYILSLIGVFIVASVINLLAETFGGRKDFISAMKVAAYFPTAAWVAGIFMLIPILAILSLLGLYSLYLLYVGLPVLMTASADKTLGYVLAVIVCAIIVWLLIAGLPVMLI